MATAQHTTLEGYRRAAIRANLEQSIRDSRDANRPSTIPGTAAYTRECAEMAEFYAIMLAPAHLYCQD